MQGKRNRELLFGDRNQQISGYGDPDLTLHGVLRTSKELVDAKMLLDPFEEQFDLPAAPIKIADRLCGDLEVVGQKDQRLASLRVFQAHPSKQLGISLSGVEDGQPDLLIADQSSRFVDWPGVDPFELQGLLCSSDEEGSGLVDGEQSLEIDVSPVHDIESTRFGAEQVENVDIVQQTVGNQHECWDGTPEVEQRMNLDCGLGLSIVGPRKQRKAQSDGRGIEGIDRSLEVQSEILFGIKPAGGADQRLRELGVDAPVAAFVGIGQVGTSDIAPDAHVIELGRLGQQTALDIAQASPVGQLSEGHAQKLIPTTKCSGIEVALVLADQPSKGVPWRQVHQLGEHELSRVHWLSSGKSGKLDMALLSISSR